MVLAVKVYQFLILDFRVWGREHIPEGPKLFVTNHITSHDSFWLMSVFPEPVHIVIGPGYQSRWVGRILDGMEQINASPSGRKTVVPEAVRYLKQGGAVYIAPEGNLQPQFELGRFYPGAAKIYRLARVPIVPIGLLAPKSSLKELPGKTVVDGEVFRTVTTLRGPYCVNIGKPILPAIPDGTEREQDEHLTSLIRRRVEEMVEDARTNKFWL